MSRRKQTGQPSAKHRKAAPRAARRRAGAARTPTPDPRADADLSARDRNPAPDFPVVVVGASAGGLDAFKKLLGAMPVDANLAIVLIPHLDPRRESMMVELLAKQTTIPVSEAAHGSALRPNNVYVIPPNRFLALRQGKIRLSRPPRSGRPDTAIDFAMRSLAKDRQDAAIGIILSGTGSHGVAGVKEIKLAGGVVFAQEPATAEFAQMPRSAIATGLVDYILPPEEMPEALVRYTRQWSQGRTETAPEVMQDGLRGVIALLQARTRHDFRYYRKHMLARRIQRRMALKQVGDWDAYARLLRSDAAEVSALRRDLLIGVTSFFRDPEAFEALAANALPELVARADADHPLRVWVPGCATGEEAYSIAMLLFEAFRAADKPANIQVFATDVDDHALEKARQGIYPDSLTSAVSADRLRQFFIRVDSNHYQVSKQLRDAVVIAPQNLITDAPFSRLDLISCRNVLIYLEPEAQEKIISLLHFALSDGGFLMLGPSESIGRATGMFQPVAKKWRLFRRVGPARRDLVTIPIAQPDERRLSPARLSEARGRPAAGFAQVMQKLLAEEFSPAAALVNGDFEMLSVQGPLVNFLEFPPGELTKNLLTMARQGLRLRIRSACRKAWDEGRQVVEPNARVRRNGRYVPCMITARPVTEPREVAGLLLVIFQDIPDAAGDSAERAAESAGDTLVDQLEKELRATREDLQSTIEELESSNEELKASNEEVMSMNEELQSTNEELETSKEELQSLNEELSTVNNQLQDKIEDLDSANSDLTNLMSATDIATIFLDTNLNIKRFTPPTARVVNLLESDIGRPMRDFAPRFRDEELLQDAKRVLQVLAPIEKTIRTDEDHWFLRRILPYKTGDQRIGGVVITFVEITSRMETEAQARRLAAVLRDSNDAIIICDLDGRITGWNRGAARAYGYTEAEAVRMNMLDLVPESHKHTVADVTRRAIAGDAIESFESRRVGRDGRPFDVWVNVTALNDEHGNAVALARTERDVTQRRQVDAEIRKLNANLEERVRERTAEIHELQEEIVRIATEEQRRIGQELHDATQQNLSGLGLLARNLSDRLPGGSREAELAAKLAAGIANTNREIRTLAKGLVPVPVDSEGLMAALGNMARDVEGAHGIPCRFECPIPVRLDDDRAAMHLYRIAQEAVANAVKHGEPGEVSVHLDGGGHELQLEVRDNGKGIDPSARNGDGLGLRIMAHRCNMIGGAFDIRRLDSGGTSVVCRVPWSRIKSS